MEQKKRLKIVYACSGCSSAAQMANWMALKMDREGFAEMSCIAGVGGAIQPLLAKARQADVIIGLDGCSLKCVVHCLARAGLNCDFHYDLSHFGVQKNYREDFDLHEAERIYSEIKSGLKEIENGSLGIN